jgi:hypothetical protein
MNERIEELAKQCYETGPLGKDGWPEYSSFNEGKFAQLIVRECAEIALLDGQATGNFETFNKITKRFGVEE